MYKVLCCEKCGRFYRIDTNGIYCLNKKCDGKLIIVQLEYGDVQETPQGARLRWKKGGEINASRDS